MRPPPRRAIASASEDLPDAVGPAIRTGRFLGISSINCSILWRVLHVILDVVGCGCPFPVNPAYPSPQRPRGEPRMQDQDTGTAGAKPLKRVMLKISGEALMGPQGFGLHPPTVERIAREVQSVHEMGVEICMVIGGRQSVFHDRHGGNAARVRDVLRRHLQGHQGRWCL